MSKINTTPRGLQEFAGNTAQGQNPDELSRIVGPNVDIVPYWSVDKTKAISATGAVTGSGFGVTIPVPTSEIWVPLVASAVITGLDPGDTVRVQLEILSPADLRVAYGQPFDAVGSVAVNDRYSIGHLFPQRILIPSGWKFTAIVEAETFTQPSENLTFSMIYVELKA